MFSRNITALLIFIIVLSCNGILCADDDKTIVVVRPYALTPARIEVEHSPLFAPAEREHLFYVDVTTAPFLERKKGLRRIGLWLGYDEGYLEIRRQAVRRYEEGFVTWRGGGANGFAALLVDKRGHMHGSVWRSGATYEIHYDATLDAQVLFKVDPEKRRQLGCGDSPRFEERHKLHREPVTK